MEALKLESANSRTFTILLGVVVMSSLPLLAFGLSPQPGQIEILQLPTTIAELLFVFATARRIDHQRSFLSLTLFQRLLLGGLIVYVFAVSFMSPTLSAPIFGPSWVVHISFFAAVVSHARLCETLDQNPIWPIFGVTAFIHVFVFFIAWAVWPESIRASALPAFNNIRHLGYFLAPAAAVMAVQFTTKSQTQMLPFFCFSAAIFYIIYSGSRGGAAAFVAGLLVVALYCAWHRIRVSGPRALMLLGVIGASVVASELLPHLPWKPLFGRGVDAISQTGTQMLTGRAEVWSNAVGAIEANWVFGYGPALMGQIPAYHGEPFRHPHNIGLQLMLHWGAVGTLIVSLTALTFLRNGWTALSAEPRKALAPLAVLVTFCIHSLVDGGLFYPFSTVVAIIAFANLEAIGFRSTHNRHSSRRS